MEPPEKRVCYEVDSDKSDSDEESIEQQTGWFDLPYEMRRMVLDMVPIGPLLKFARCSKQCSEDVWDSTNYFKEIRLTELPKKFRIQFTDDRYGPSIEFIKRSSYNSYVVIHIAENGKVDSIQNIFEKPNDVVLKYLEVFLRNIGHNLKVLDIRVKNQMRNRLVRTIKLGNLKKLTHFALGGRSQPICPLKWNFVDFEQVCNVKHTIDIIGIFIDYANLTPIHLNKYMKLWRDGKLHKNFRSIDISAGYTKKQAERRIELNLDGLECEELKESGYHVSFKLKSSCEWLQNLVADVCVMNKGMKFIMRIEDGSET